jgi:hypothetical protein
MALTKPFLTFPDTGIRTGMKADGKNYIPNPSSYSVLMSDVDLDDKRSTSAILNRNRIRQNVYTVTCSWDRLTDYQLYRLLTACQAEKFSLKFRDPLNITDRYTTKSEMYADANKEVDLVSTEDDDEDFWSASLSFVEY